MRKDEMGRDDKENDRGGNGKVKGTGNGW